LLWGAVYGGFAEWHLRRYKLPDWVKGLLFAVIPLALALLFVLPTLGLGFPGVRSPAGARLSELIRHLAYGLVLGLTFPVFLTRHLGRPAGAHLLASVQDVKAPPEPEEVGVGAGRDAAPTASC
jgi:hypothetical protein